MTTFVCVRCRTDCDTANGYRDAPAFGKQHPPGSLYCAECMRDLESWEKESAILRKQKVT